MKQHMDFAQPTRDADRQALCDDLESNKATAALVRDSEAELIRLDGPRPVDLRLLPRDQWDTVLHYDVTLPPHLCEALADGPVDPAAVPSLEEALDRWHGVSEPYYIAMSGTMKRRGRAWAYLLEAAPYLTGFSLQKDDGSGTS